MKLKLMILALNFALGCENDEEEPANEFLWFMDILAYEYDPQRLCLIDPESPLFLKRQDLSGQIPPSKCSVDESRNLVVFQSYFENGFVECDEEEFGELANFSSQFEVSDLKCEGK